LSYWGSTLLHFRKNLARAPGAPPRAARAGAMISREDARLSRNMLECRVQGAEGKGNCEPGVVVWLRTLVPGAIIGVTHGRRPR